MKPEKGERIMDKMTFSKGASTLAFLLTMLLSTSGTSFAYGPGNQQHHGKGMHQNCPSGNFSSRAEMMKSSLNLNDEQQVLMTEMHQANMALMNKECPDGWKSGCMNKKGKMRAMHLFRAELGAEKPDFQAVADRLKNEYKGENQAEFDEAVDARARFMESLTPEQRDAMMQMRYHGKHGGWHSMQHGQMNKSM